MVVVFLVDTLVYSTYIFRGVVLARVDEVGGGNCMYIPKCKTYKHTRTSYETYSGTQLTATRLDMVLCIRYFHKYCIQIRSPCPVRQKTWSPIFLRPFPSPFCIGYHFSIGKRSFALRCVSSSWVRAGLDTGFDNYGTMGTFAGVLCYLAGANWTNRH